jgi:general secretion pathway protein G
MKQKKTMRRKSFTMIEIVVVIVILVALASIATPLYMNHVKKANIGTAKTQIKLLEDALASYKLDVGTYPSTDDGLQALMTNPGDSEKWNGPYIKPAVPKDPWGNDYVYTSPGEHGDFDLLSYGADGQPGGEGEDADITNYVAE